MKDTLHNQASPDKRVFGYAEVIFNALYLIAAAFIGIYILARAKSLPQTLSGIMALVLAGGDAFHLVPRMGAAITGAELRFKRALGLGKLITSATMTAFYVLLWHIGVLLFAPGIAGAYTITLYGLAALRMLLCLFPQNKWVDDMPPVRWGVYRNLPFLLMGIQAAILYAGRAPEPLRPVWLAIALSFAFYIPVVLFSNGNRRVGMLMLPKTLAYLWILIMFAQLA